MSQLDISFCIHKKWYQSVQQNRSFILNTQIPTRVPPPYPILSYLPLFPFLLTPNSSLKSQFQSICSNVTKSNKVSLNPVLHKESTLKSKQIQSSKHPRRLVWEFHKTPPPSLLLWISLLFVRVSNIPEFESVHTGPVHVCMVMCVCSVIPTMNAPWVERGVRSLRGGAWRHSFMWISMD